MPHDVGELAARLQVLEDKLALYQILSAFSPVVDGGGEEAAAAFFTEDGSYVMDAPGVPPATGRAAVQKIYEADMHRTAIREGVSHMLGFPHLKIDGDRAHAITYACIFRRDDTGWRVARVAANAFEFRRQSDGWRFTKRTSRELKSEEARAVFANAPLDLPWTT